MCLAILLVLALLTLRVPEEEKDISRSGKGYKAFDQIREIILFLPNLRSKTRVLPGQQELQDPCYP